MPPPHTHKTHNHTQNHSHTIIHTQQVPKSVCLTLGGFREAKYLQTYNVAVRCRKGFARLAAETGAALVPVIGVGEPYVVGEPTFGARILKLVAP